MLEKERAFPELLPQSQGSKIRLVVFNVALAFTGTKGPQPAPDFYLPKVPLCTVHSDR